MKYGYIRPVTINDSVTEQTKKIGIYTKNILEEMHANNKKRNELNTLLNSKLVFGDILYITDLCIIADSTKHLVDILDLLSAKGVSLYVINLNKNLITDSNENFIKTLHNITDFQSDIVKFRTRMGLENYTREGKSLGRPKRDDKSLRDAIEMYMSKKYTLNEIKATTNISRATLYRHLDK
ncbi:MULTISPECIES: recombinase family protein [unclassified Staphylococcus]|uniref:recombinase family protein n=1 Tax=Staphylococcus TaxID=1279 RepID=UPI0021CFB2A3|nr:MULTISPECIES: recombinase family protein [unclassified Staphylococcus]UXR71701.1 recombinase family protein [Staphylococcus sp. IVB6240]UXR74027.1 recombinase family protein [Staphylococcus sp. IVB6238]UXR76397.1 recombinase family protein [Staphylococcus sp. IVB6233]UXR78432.1 recombinase family protein [Staphylococcus sp. IVB6227]UXR80523.1 recombinase family protein [Staphylococcus sp. IVB6218]